MIHFLDAYPVMLTFKTGITGVFSYGPASTKYRETQKDPYAQLAELGRESIRTISGSQKILITCGYGFADSHINLEIDRALRESEGRLTVVVFHLR